MIKIHISIDGSEHAEVVAHIERGELQAGNVGLTLAEAKSVLVTVQKALVGQQTAAWVAQHRQCPTCGTELRPKGHHAIMLRTVFGKMNIRSPRLYRCACEDAARGSFSPLAQLLSERTTPGLQYTSMSPSSG